MKTVQQANGKRRLSSAQQARGRLLRLHGPRYLVHLFSVACFACTALAISSLGFRPPASLARPSLSFHSFFGRLLRLHGPRYLFALFSAACFACTASFALFVLFSLSFRSLFVFVSLVFRCLLSLGCSWALLGTLGRSLGPSWALLGLSWALLGLSWPLLGRS